MHQMTTKNEVTLAYEGSFVHQIGVFVKQDKQHIEEMRDTTRS